MDLAILLIELAYKFYHGLEIRKLNFRKDLRETRSGRVIGKKLTCRSLSGRSDACHHFNFAYMQFENRIGSTSSRERES